MTLRKWSKQKRVAAAEWEESVAEKKRTEEACPSTLNTERDSFTHDETVMVTGPIFESPALVFSHYPLLLTLPLVKMKYGTLAG